MSTEGKILLGMTVGGAIVTGTLPQLLLGIAVGYIVFICHSRMVNDELDQILDMVDAKLSTLDENDGRRAQLEKLRTKATAKKEVATLGSSLVAAGTVLCPPAGLAYVAGRWAWKQRAIASASAAINERIAAAKRPALRFC